MLGVRAVRTPRAFHLPRFRSFLVKATVTSPGPLLAKLRSSFKQQTQIFLQPSTTFKHRRFVSFSMTEAKYFHSTLYRFAPAAFQEVILRFNSLMKDVSARCWYDTTQDVSRTPRNTS